MRIFLKFIRLRFVKPLVMPMIFLISLSPASANESLTLAIQPIYGMERTNEAFKPLANYLSRIIDAEVKIKTFPNFIAYWNDTRDGHGYDLILDAAHFTGYRAKELDFVILAKIQGTVSYSVIVPESSMVMDIDELVGKKIATLGPPSMGAAKMALLFDNPLRQPYMYETENSEKALDLLFTDEVDAAIIPTPLVASLTGVAVVTITDPTQHIALSASPAVSSDLRQSIHDALIFANTTAEGKMMLSRIGFSGFENPDTDRYVLAADLLQLTGLD